ncbi:hypothetical protein ABW19_dt0207953 [Dactylella cylindrospora]|nr:hypothetical protein ABW19_dt0207953 [Dactylella cylindrospora]
MGFSDIPVELQEQILLHLDWQNHSSCTQLPGCHRVITDVALRVAISEEREASIFFNPKGYQFTETEWWPEAPNEIKLSAIRDIHNIYFEEPLFLLPNRTAGEEAKGYVYEKSNRYFSRCVNITCYYPEGEQRAHRHNWRYVVGESIGRDETEEAGVAGKVTIRQFLDWLLERVLSESYWVDMAQGQLYISGGNRVKWAIDATVKFFHREEAADD